MPSRAPLRLGLIGAGRWGRTLARVISTMPGMQLSVVATRNPESKAFFPEQDLVSDWQALLERPLDGVIVASPPATHSAPSLAAIELGLPVMIEKPMTSSAETADALLIAAEYHGTPVLVDHTQLFAPGVIALRKRLLELGEPCELVLHSGAWGPFRPDVPVLWDWGAHDVALALYLCAFDQKPLSLRVESVVRRSWSTLAGEPCESVTLSLRGSACGVSVRVANCLGAKERLVEACVGGRVLTYREYPERRLVEHHCGVATVLPFPDRGPLDGALEEFERRIRERDPSSDSIRLGAKVVEVLDRAQDWLAS